MKKVFRGKYGPLLIAEIGGNHEGDFKYAKKLTQLAACSMVDFVKFQIYTGDMLVSSNEAYDRNKHFKKFELSQKQHIYLADMVKEAGKGYMASVWDIDSIRWIDKYLSIYKIGSGDLTAYPLLRNISMRGKPIILSTGLASEKEVLDAVAYIQDINKDYHHKEKLCLLQCTSMYPIPYEDANLNVMYRLKDLTGLTVGYSDHTEGTKALYLAASMGAEVLEFHITDSRKDKVFRDHKVSLIPEEIESLVNEIQIIPMLKGGFTKRPLDIEISNNHCFTFRRGVYPSISIKKGEILTEENLTVLRPNHGIDARDYQKLIGKKAKNTLKKHQKLHWSLIE